MRKEAIPQIAGGRFHADALLRRVPRDIVAVAIKLKIMLARQSGHKYLIGIRLRPAQPVIEMSDGENDSQFVPQLQQQPQERDGIDSTGNGDASAVPSLQQFLTLNVGEHVLCQRMHGHMVQQGLCGDSRHRARKNNGQARERRAGFCGNAAQDRTSLLDDLRFNEESTGYAQTQTGFATSSRISGLQNHEP